jgi:peptide chain release factor subunit 1
LVGAVLSKNPHFSSCQLGTSTSVKQHKLRKNIAWLASVGAKDKELISLYMPSTIPTELAIAALKKDLECANTVPLHVQEHFEAAQKKLVQHVRELKSVSQNGVALFAGIFPIGTGEHLSLEEIIPPQPIAGYLYQVDDHFYLEPLREMLRSQKIVGILTIDSKQASFGVQNGERIELNETITSGIPGKTGKGGQSQRRYERERDMEVTAFFHRVAERATKAFLENSVNVLVVGGPGQTKNAFLKGEFLNYELANMVLGVVDTQSAGKEALTETLEKSQDALANMCGPEERKVVQSLLIELSKPYGGLATYGLDEVMISLKAGQVRVVIVADDTCYREVLAVCKECGQPRSKITANLAEGTKEIVSLPCERCRGTAFEVAERDIVEVLEDLASQTNASVEVVSTASEEKTQLNALGGVAALLRYKPALTTAK